MLYSAFVCVKPTGVFRGTSTMSVGHLPVKSALHAYLHSLVCVHYPKGVTEVGTWWSGYGLDELLLQLQNILILSIDVVILW